MSPLADKGPIAFAEKLLGLLGQASFTSTYKYAVILGLMDLCLEHSARSGAAPSMVTTRQLAEKVVELYWSHTLGFRAGPVLRQNTGTQAKIVSLIEDFRDRHAGDTTASLARSRTAAPGPFERLLREIEWVLVEMPLPKLQRVGRELHPFVYQIAWSDDVRKGEFNSDAFDNRICFVAGAGDHLVRLSGLIRPIVQNDWTRRVARINSCLIEDSELEDFLFGASRIDLTPVRRDLRDLQDGRCFYCENRIARNPQVDHFVPWARYPNNGIENLVLADKSCNNAKRDHLVAAAHVDKWVERSLRARHDLASIARSRSWESHPDRSLSVARSIYLRLPEDARLWREAEEFVPVERRLLIDAFARGTA